MLIKSRVSLQKTAYALVFLAISASANAQFNRCTIDGKTVYSDQPCPDSGPTVREVFEHRRAQEQDRAKADAQAQADCDAWLRTEPELANSVWDGSVYEVDRWLKRNTRNPKSLQVMEWGRLVRHCNGYVVRVKYRAQNGFGGMVIEHAAFQLNRAGEVTSIDPLH